MYRSLYLTSNLKARQRQGCSRRSRSRLPPRSRGCQPSQSPEQYRQTKEKRKGGEMGSSHSQSQARGGRRNVQSHANRKQEIQGLEAGRHQVYLCGRKLYAKKSQVRTIHSSLRSAHEKGQCDPPRTENYLSVGYFGRQEKSIVAALHQLGSDDQGNRAGSQC